MLSTLVGVENRQNSWDLTSLIGKKRQDRKYEINRWTRRGKIILIKGKYRPKNDFYFCYIFHVSKIVSFRMTAEKRLLKHFADFRRLPV